MMTNENKELISSLLDYLDRLCPSILGLCEEIQYDDLTNISLLSEITEGLDWVKSATTILNQDLNLSLQGELASIEAALNELLNTLENEDYVFLADILEENIVPCLEKIFSTTSPFLD